MLYLVRDKSFLWPPELTKLRNDLANCYPRKEDIERIIDEAGIPRADVKIGGTSKNAWHNVLWAAIKQSKTKKINEIGSTEYPNKIDYLGDRNHQKFHRKIYQTPILVLIVSVLLITYIPLRVPKDMVRMKAGTIIIGKAGSDGDDAPAHLVYLDAYWFDQYEVTVKNYLNFCSSHSIAKPHEPSQPFHPKYFTDPQWFSYPVVNVTWQDAQAYCEGNGKRLPTEAEWENAARYWDEQDHLNPFIWQNHNPTGNYPDQSLLKYFPHITVNPGNDGYPFTSPVGKFPANGNGIYDLDGNVSEWCLDAYSRDYYEYSSNKNPYNHDSNTTQSVVRGPSWAEWYDLVTKRNHVEQTEKNSHIGFRCALSDAKHREKQLYHIGIGLTLSLFVVISAILEQRER